MQRSKVSITLQTKFNPVVHDSMRPLLVFWRFTGLFPTSTLGEIPNRVSFGRVRPRLNWTVVITLLVALLTLSSISLFLSEASGMKMSDVINASLPIFLTCDFISGLLSTLYMLRISSALMRYVIKWSTISGEMEVGRSLRSLAIKLVILNAVFIAVALTLEGVSMFNDDASRGERNTTFTPPVSTRFKFNCVHLISNVDLIRMSSVIHLAIYFCRCVQLHLHHLSLRVDSTELNSAFQLTELRNVYNRLVNMADELATLLSPLLLLILAENTVTMTWDIASLYFAITKRDAADVTVYYSIFNKIWYRFAQIAWLCSCAEEMGVMPQKIITNLLSKSCQLTVSSTKFQFDLLKSCLVLRKPTLDASGYLNLNNALLLEVIGILVTYTVLMAQMDNS